MNTTPQEFIKMVLPQFEAIEPKPTHADFTFKINRSGMIAQFNEIEGVDVSVRIPLRKPGRPKTVTK